MPQNPESYPFVKSKGADVVLLIKLAPRSSSNRIIGQHAGRLKIAVTAPPVDGKANELLIEFLAKVLALAKRSISISRGQTSRDKEVVISGVNIDQVISAINGSIK
jgi:uncharacterized protein (TIGR00251 family)